MVDMNFNTVDAKEITLNNIQDFRDHSRAIKENMKFAVEIVRDGIKPFHNLCVSLMKIDDIGNKAPYHDGE